MSLSSRLLLHADLIKCCRTLAGHSHWQNIAKIKGAEDAKRGKLLTFWIPKIRLEARNESNLEKNRSLKKLAEQAKIAGVPLNAIKNAITAWDNADFKEHQFGVQGKDGFMALLDCATISVKKTENEIQTLLRRHNFKYASVSFTFKKYNDIGCRLQRKYSEDELEELALECGTEDYTVDDENDIITFTVEHVNSIELIKEAKNHGLAVLSQSMRYEADEMVSITNSEAIKRIGMFMKSLDMMPEVENVHHNIENMDQILSQS